MSRNTTEHLVADMEQLRNYLGVYRWLLFGGSWGSTLILAYAERYPQRVSEIVIAGVTTTRRSETDWLYRGVARFFPEEWERFRAGVPECEHDDAIVAAYSRLMEDPDPEIRSKAAIDWATWEDAVLSLEQSGNPNPYSDRAPADLQAFVRIATHYFSNGAWLKEGSLLSGARLCPESPACLSMVASIWALLLARLGSLPELGLSAPGCRGRFRSQGQRLDERAHIRRA